MHIQLYFRGYIKGKHLYYRKFLVKLQANSFLVIRKYLICFWNDIGDFYILYATQEPCNLNWIWIKYE